MGFGDGDNHSRRKETQRIKLLEGCGEAGFLQRQGGQPVARESLQGSRGQPVGGAGGDGRGGGPPCCIGTAPKRGEMWGSPFCPQRVLGSLPGTRRCGQWATPIFSHTTCPVIHIHI